MAVNEFPNEWEGIPKETVADWLDHPCTRRLREKLRDGITECNEAVVRAAESHFQGFSDAPAISRTLTATLAIRSGYSQALALIGKGEEYVKAK